MAAALGFITTVRATIASWRGGTRSSCPGSSCTTARPSRGLPAPKSTSPVSWSKTGFSSNVYKACGFDRKGWKGDQKPNAITVESLNMLNRHISMANDPQTQRKNLKENKRVSSHTLFIILVSNRRILVSVKLLEVHVCEDTSLSTTDLSFCSFTVIELMNVNQLTSVFLSRGWGFCLDDRPSKRDLTTPLARLGVRYTTHHQCQLQYGPNATFCNEVDVSNVSPLKVRQKQTSSQRV